MNAQSYGSGSSGYGVTTSVSSVPRVRVPAWPVIVIGGALSAAGTSSAEPNRVWDPPYVRDCDPTASGRIGLESAIEDEERPTEAPRQAVSELRRISGLTWEQLGQLFGVSRRSVHFWASGKPLNTANDERLRQVLDIVRVADRGDASATRSALLEVQGGKCAFDLLVGGRFEEASTRLEVGPGRARPVLGELSAREKATRMPLRPEELVDALQDRVHPTSGRLLAAKPIKLSRRK